MKLCESGFGDVGQVTPELMELGRMGIIKWTTNGFEYPVEYEYAVAMALHKSSLVCQTCHQAIKHKQWNQIIKELREVSHG